MSVSLITGVTGQDGVLLARRLLADGDTVIGTCRPGSEALSHMAPYLDGVRVVPLDLRDTRGFDALVHDLRPDAVFNLGAISSVRHSWDFPEQALDTNGRAVESMLASLASLGNVRFVQAASAEEHGEAAESPYAVGKAMARDAVLTARESGLFAAAAVLHIHESPLRRPEFVVRKVTKAVAEIVRGTRERLVLGPLHVRRDWGAAVDYVDAMIRIMRADEPADFEVGTGRIVSLREVVAAAFEAGGLGDFETYVDFDPALSRPVDAGEIASDPRRLREVLGWAPQFTIEQVVAQMVAADLRRLETGVAEDPTYLSTALPPVRAVEGVRR